MVEVEWETTKQHSRQATDKIDVPAENCLSSLSRQVTVTSAMGTNFF